ncbi:MAG: hypothetical protein GY727_11790, partial [Gammaproteobacteria bacterium]|nr:hypothetical protein [Gammaproteobacteria bacterium]
MSFTRIASATGTTGSTVSTLDTSSTLNVVAGDLLVCFLSGDSNFSSFDCAEDDGTTNIFTVFNPTQDQWYG